MVKIFQIEDGSLKPTEDIMLIGPFKEIWERDKTKTKSRAIKDYTFIHFVTSPYPSNPYRELPKEERIEVIKKEVVGENYKPDKVVMEAIELYTKWIEDYSLSYRMLQSAKKATNELIEFLNNIDLKERTRSGTPVYKPNEVSTTISKVKSITKELNELEKLVFEDLKEMKTYGNKDINPLEQ